MAFSMFNSYENMSVLVYKLMLKKFFLCFHKEIKKAETFYIKLVSSFFHEINTAYLFIVSFGFHSSGKEDNKKINMKFVRWH